MSSIKIKLENYEEYALDFLEGNLDASTKRSFEAFLEFHPEIAEEMEGLMEMTLVKPALPFTEKEILYKPTEGNRRFEAIILLVTSVLLILFFAYFLIDKTSSNKSEPEIPIIEDVNRKKEADRPSIPMASNQTETNSQEEVNNAENELAVVSPRLVEKTSRIAAEENAKNTPTKPAQNRPVMEDKEVSDKIQYSVIDQNEMRLPEMADTQLMQVAQQDLEIVPFEKTHEAVELIAYEQPEALTGHTFSNNKPQELAIKMPEIKIDTTTDDNYFIVASNDKKQKSKFFRLKNLIPEQFAGITGEDIKKSMIPEVITSR